MAPSFSYGRGRRLYAYYVSRSILARQPVPPGQFVGRVPAIPLESLVSDRVRRLMGEAQPWTWDDVIRLLDRVELRERSIQLVLRSSELLEPCETVVAAQERLWPNLDDSTRSKLVAALNDPSRLKFSRVSHRRSIAVASQGRSAADRPRGTRQPQGQASPAALPLRYVRACEWSPPLTPRHHLAISLASCR